jgi:DNA-binding IclR family transcriptional regulator
MVKSTTGNGDGRTGKVRSRVNGKVNGKVRSEVRSDVGVLDKMMLLLNELDASPASLPALSAATGLHRATAHRLLSAMAVHGLTRQDDAARWSLGPACRDLGRRAAKGLPLQDAAMPALTGLRDLTGESTQLYVREGEFRVCVAATESLHGLRTIVALGAVLPLNLGSAGRILRGDAASLRRGWAESVGEREAGVASVSAPVMDTDGVIRAAVSVSGPLERTSKQPGAKWGDAVIAAARAIEQAAGWSELT